MALDGGLGDDRRKIGSVLRSVASTSQDVARLAGVSQPTVSLVLSGRGDEMRLSPATQKRVVAAAERLGFVPNHAARSLRRRSTRVVTVISPSLENPFFAEVVGALQDAANLRGYATNVMLARDSLEEARAIAHVLGGTADALVVASHYTENSEALRSLSRRGTPCVVLQQRDDDLQVPSITVDLEAGGYLATRHLIALGHRRIAHVTDEREHRGRRAGFLRALQEADIEPDPRLIVETENSLAGGSRATERLLAMAGGPPSAVFAYNDQLALGLLHGMQRAGRRVPDDLAVVGFDNTVSGAFASPELTTVAHERNSLTAQMLFALLDGTTPPARQEAVPIWLVVRESCGASRNKKKT